MRRIALLLMAIGSLFLLDTVHIWVAGIDLLLDPVGFLFIFNGARPLHKLGDKFAPCIPLGLVLLVLASLQLFLPVGGLALATACLRYGGQAALLLLLGRGLAALPDIRPSRAKLLTIWLTLVLNILAALLLAVLAILGWALVSWQVVCLLVLQLFLPTLLLWLALGQTDAAASTPPRA